MNEKNPSIVALALTAFLALSTFWAGVRMEFPATVKAASAPITYVKTYANFVHGTTQQKDLTPEGVQATSDGGYILLASTLCITQACVTAQGNSNPVVNWIVKTDSSGNPQWQKELGCFKAPGGDYTIGVVIQQALDGGYIVGGGALNDGANCGAGGTQQRAIVEKLDSGGNLVWAKSYSTGANGEGITAIKPTTDGGFVAAGGVYDVGPSPGGGMVLKLDSAGVVQWQTVVGPTASTTAWLLAIQQTSDGGYVSTGNYYVSSSQCQPFECQGGLVVKIDSTGKVQWQQALNPGTSSSLSTDSIVQTSDDGFVAAGAWFGTSQKGGLLVKLDSSGNILWQNAYSGGSYLGTELGVVIYSVHQTSDGGFFLAGDGEDKLQEGGRLVPWIGKVDASGNLLWEQFYYQIYAPTGRALSEYFAGADVAEDGGFIAAGYTEDYLAQRGLLLVVKTDSSGQCGSCIDMHPDEGLTAINPGLTISPPALPVRTRATQGVSLPSKTRSTAIQNKKDC
jgi:hypothetical protein